jgi:DNA-binding NarL/FixJ family response regulator
MIKVLIAEDMHLIRGALTALLEREKDMSVVAELDRGDLIVATALATRPDVAVLDIGLPGVDGLSAAKQLHDVLPECQVVILTGMTQPGNLLRALKVHVRGFIPKDAPARTLADGIRRVAAGERVIDSGHGRGRAGDRREPAHGPGKRTCRARPRTVSPPRRSVRGFSSRRRPFAITCRTPSPKPAAAAGSTPSG